MDYFTLKIESNFLTCFKKKKKTQQNYLFRISSKALKAELVHTLPYYVAIWEAKYNRKFV